MKTNPPTMKIKLNDKKCFRVEIPLGIENGDFGLLIHDFAASELSGFEEGVELKTYTWMQSQSNGVLSNIKTIRAIEGWRMRMRREFLEWGNIDSQDCWDYIPVGLREWCDTENSSEKWREFPVLFLWRCQLWQSRLRGCMETPKFPRDPEEEISLWEEDYGWVYSPMDNKIIWTRENQFPFSELPEDVSDYLIKDWLTRLENPSTPTIWDENYKGQDQIQSCYTFEEWTGRENWIPNPLSSDPVILEKWNSLS